MSAPATQPPAESARASRPAPERPDVAPTGQVQAALDGLFSGIDHVGIAVPDLDEALSFYADTLGIVSVHEEVNEDQGVREAMLVVGTGQTRIQLLAPLSPSSTIGRFLDRHGPGLQQLAVTVADVDQASHRLRAAGLRLLYDTPRRGTAGSRVNFVHPKDVGGVLLELVEPAGGH